jgi:hypothetical protein
LDDRSRSPFHSTGICRPCVSQEQEPRARRGARREKAGAARPAGGTRSSSKQLIRALDRQGPRPMLGGTRSGIESHSSRGVHHATEGIMQTMLGFINHCHDCLGSAPAHDVFRGQASVQGTDRPRESHRRERRLLRCRICPMHEDRRLDGSGVAHQLAGDQEVEATTGVRGICYGCATKWTDGANNLSLTSSHCSVRKEDLRSARPPCRVFRLSRALNMGDAADRLRCDRVCGISGVPTAAPLNFAYRYAADHG